jgi:glycosyltransferase involved in cell wall biosynthesis
MSEASQTRLRILMTSPMLSRPGGVAQYLRVVQPHFRSEIDYLTVGSRSDVEHAGHSVLRLAGDCWRFTRTLMRKQYKMVHLNPSLGSKALARDGILLLIAKIFGRSVVVFTHGWDSHCERALAGTLLPLFRCVYGRADAFIVLGKEFEKGLRALGYRKAIFVEGAPIEDEFLTDGREAAQAESVSKRRSFRILFLARMERSKGVYEALDTFQILQRTHSFVEMTMVGGGAELDRARDYAKSRGLAKIEFLGHLQGLAKLKEFQRADAYLFPSWTEGLPISVLEAMAQGLPIVASAVGGLPDFFQNGKMGFLTERLEPEVFASLLNELVTNPILCSEIAHFNRVYAREHFRATQVAARLEDIYRALHQCAH